MGPLRDHAAVAPRWPARSAFDRGLGYYGLQAAVAECHAVATTVDDTDWPLIVRAVRRARARSRRHPSCGSTARSPSRWPGDPVAALPLVDELSRRASATSGPFHAVRAELLERTGDADAAASAFLTAAALPGNDAEAEVLRRRAAALGVDQRAP